MEAFEIEELRLRLQATNQRYLEFLRVPALSVGVYHLFAGMPDPQQPHTEDEVYYVISGQAVIRVGAEDRAVEAGSVIYVAANVEHRFHTITEDLTVLVFFAPAEYSQQ
jgi:mannose-6-phosphate isomerase-like protein (cupin superfamily)